MRRRAAAARVARLGTADGRGTPHVVPVTFALEDDRLYSAVDRKPKRTTRLRRLRNIEANPSVTVLVDHYEETWDALWWVQIRGSARVLDGGSEAEHAIDLLAEKYPQYQVARPPGPVIAIECREWRGWSAAG